MFALGCLLLAVAAPTIKAASVTCNEFPIGRRTFTNDSPFNLMPLPLCPTEIDPMYEMFTRSSRTGDFFDTNSAPSAFNPSHKTIFVIHGWSNDRFSSPWMYEIMNNFLDVGDYNIVIVDWGGGAKKANYNLSASTTRTAGAWTAEVMNSLVNRGLSWDDLYCVGHSLGSHCCGHAGAWDGGVIGRITGLDPAGPMFQGKSDLSVGLNSNSGKFVDIMHTDDDVNGTKRKLGHMDFYPNGGSVQPACLVRSDTAAGSCDHQIVHTYYIESIKTDCFASRQTCTDEYNMPGSCSTHALVKGRMGAWAQCSGLDGIYRLDTTGASPYCMG